MLPIDEVHSLKDQRPKTEEDSRKEMLLEVPLFSLPVAKLGLILAQKADALRTRLQLALFKVQTNQVSKPFARLHVPKARSSSPELPAFSSSSPKSDSTIKGSSIQRVAWSPESRIALARARASMVAKPATKILSSLPMPRITPTAFSHRYIDDIHVNQVITDSQVRSTHVPSSAPLSQEKNSTATHLSTARNGPGIVPITPVLTSSPAGSPPDVNED